MTTTPKPSLAEAHLGIIATLAHRYWKSIPRHAIALYSIEDLIAEGVAKVVGATPKYDPTRTKESTFVWKVVENHFRYILTRLHRQRYPLDAPASLSDLTVQVGRASHEVEWTEARREIEKILADALRSSGEDTQELLSNLLAGTTPRRVSSSAVKELRHLVKKHSASEQSFRMACNWAV